MESSWIALLDPVATAQLTCPMIFEHFLILFLLSPISDKNRADEDFPLSFFSSSTQSKVFEKSEAFALKNYDFLIR